MAVQILLATNYDPFATLDDGTCVYDLVHEVLLLQVIYCTELIHDRVRVNWDNMNDAQLYGYSIPY